MKTKPLPQKLEKITFSPIKEVAAKVDESRKKGIRIWNFSGGRPDLDTPAHIKKATQQAIEDGLVHYTPSIGLSGLREAICRRYEEDYQLEIDPDEVIVTAGSTEAIYVALQAILSEGDEVLAPQPMYVYYDGWSLLGGGWLVTFPLLEKNGFSLSAEDVRSHISPKTKALILTSPHNPTGQVFEEEELTKVAEMAIKEDFFVICDDVYNRLLYDNAKHFPIAKLPGMKDRTLIIGSLSKTYAMDGWRIGYLISPRHLMSRFLKMHQYTVNCCNTFVQIGAQVALSGSQECVHEMVKEFDRRRLLLLSYLDDLRIPCVRPRGAFYVFPSISRFGLTSKEFSDFLLNEARVAVVPGDSFGPGGAGFVRMAYCMSCEEIEQAMESVRTAVRKL